MSNRDGNFEVYVMNTDGTGLARVTTHPADEGHPTWRP
jgi:Tol biopolymer transport system component